MWGGIPASVKTTFVLIHVDNSLKQFVFVWVQKSNSWSSSSAKWPKCHQLSQRVWIPAICFVYWYIFQQFWAFEGRHIYILMEVFTVFHRGRRVRINGFQDWYVVESEKVSGSGAGNAVVYNTYILQILYLLNYSSLRKCFESIVRFGAKFYFFYTRIVFSCTLATTWKKEEGGDGKKNI